MPRSASRRRRRVRFAHAGFSRASRSGNHELSQIYIVERCRALPDRRAVPRRPVCEGDSRYAGRVRRQVGRGGRGRPDGPRVDLGDAAPPADALARSRTPKRNSAIFRRKMRRSSAVRSNERTPRTDWGRQGLPRATRRGQGSVAQSRASARKPDRNRAAATLTGSRCWVGRSLCNRGGPRRCNSGSRGGAPAD